MDSEVEPGALAPPGNAARHPRERARATWKHMVAMAVLALGAGARVDAAEPALTPPRPIESVKAEYPPAALAARREGSVVVLATLDRDGNVTDTAIATSSGDAALDAAALAAAARWRFSPALADGRAIESQVRIPFHFHAPPPPATPPPPSAPATPPANAPSAAGATPLEPAPGTPARSYESNVAGRRQPPSRGASDYHVDVGALSVVPRANASDYLKLAPGILLTNEGGQNHAQQIFLRGFDAREGQDLEISVDGMPINESGNLHGNGYADTNFIIPELIQSLRVVEGPFDPRQGNYAVAGSADFHLGLAERGLGAKFTVGSYGTYRLLLSWAPEHQSDGTFIAAELYQTSGFGQNRDGRGASAMAQYEGRFATGSWRILASAYSSSFHSAGVLRDDDYRAGRVGFYDTYDPLQGEESSRYSVTGEVESRHGRVTVRNQVFGIARPMRLRESFTGFLLDVQEPQQTPHGQRGDLLDLAMMEGTVGLRGSARLGGTLLHQPQAIELGYFARGDFVSGSQQRIEAATGHPYLTEAALDSRLGDIGLYLDADLHPLRWLTLRGGVRGDLFTFDVHDQCAVHSVEHPSPSHPPGDASCLDQQNFGAHREPDQRASTVSSAYMPRGTLVLGPWWGLSASGAAGIGVRSIDPSYITQDLKTPFATIAAYEGGLGFSRSLGGVEVAARSVVFYTKVDRELIFSQSAGRNLLAGSTSRLGSATSVRATGRFYDLAAHLTYTRATFDSDGLLVPYVPDLVFRFDGALHGEIPGRRLRPLGKPLVGALGVGVTYVGPRPLPYGARSDTIFTVDANATLRWWFVELGLSITNLANTRYRLGEYNYASNFAHDSPLPTLVPVRHFSAGAPQVILFSIALHYGGGR